MAFHPFSSPVGHGQSAHRRTPPEGFIALAQLGRPDRHYDPNQPRVPAGHRDGGQWTRVGSRLGARADRRDGEVLSDVSPFWILGGQYAANDNWENLDRSHNGRGPRSRHQIGVAEAIKNYEMRGYTIAVDHEVEVRVPGFATPRKYDFVVHDPVNDVYIGIEVKTTLYDIIYLDDSQVAKDVVVVALGGRAAGFIKPIKGVGYTTSCWGCDLVPDVRSLRLRDALKDAGIQFQHGGRPGEVRP